MGSEFLTEEDFSQEMKGGGGDPPPFLESEKSFSRVFDEYFIYFLSMNLGMTSEEYWEQNHSVTYYRKANEIRLARENYNQWRNGVYMIRAISACFGGENSRYLDEPLPMTAKEQLLQEERQRKRQYNLMKARFEKDFVGVDNE